MTLTLSRAAGDWLVTEAAEKLAFRASLPGAFGYDQAAHLLRALQADGVDAMELLPVALPTTWMVNSKASSRAFRAWLVEPARAVWGSLLGQLGAAMSLEQWPALSAQQREAIARDVTTLAAVEGAGLSAVSKVLGLLRPQLVPLMDDAAVAFATGLVPATTEESATAKPTVFLPMLDWFAAQVAASEAELIALAAGHPHAILDAPQVLDRLLWMDAMGERYRRGSRA